MQAEEPQDESIHWWSLTDVLSMANTGELSALHKDLMRSRSVPECSITAPLMTMGLFLVWSVFRETKELGSQQGWGKCQRQFETCYSQIVHTRMPPEPVHWRPPTLSHHHACDGAQQMLKDPPSSTQTLHYNSVAMEVQNKHSFSIWVIYLCAPALMSQRGTFFLIILSVKRHYFELGALEWLIVEVETWPSILLCVWVNLLCLSVYRQGQSTVFLYTV